MLILLLVTWDHYEEVFNQKLTIGDTYFTTIDIGALNCMQALLLFNYHPLCNSFLSSTENLSLFQLIDLDQQFITSHQCHLEQHQAAESS